MTTEVRQTPLSLRIVPLVRSGKLKDLQDRLAVGDIDTVIFDDELKPGQMRALEKALGSNVSLCDRTALILDIFSQRAASREGQLQVLSFSLSFPLIFRPMKVSEVGRRKHKVQDKGFSCVSHPFRLKGGMEVA